MTRWERLHGHALTVVVEIVYSAINLAQAVVDERDRLRERFADL